MTAKPARTGRGAAPVPVPAQLPPGPPFAGRRDELASLDALLPASAEAPEGGPGGAAISVLSGTAGVGKTALAVHWARRVSARFPDGQLFASLRGFDPAGAAIEPGDALRGFLEAFGIPEARIPAELAGQAGLYRSVLAGKRVLVVLDNARDEKQVRPLLPASPGCVAVVTSRNRLVGLVATEGASALTLDLLSPGDARELLTRRLGPTRVTSSRLPYQTSSTGAPACRWRLPSPPRARSPRPSFPWPPSPVNCAAHRAPWTPSPWGTRPRTSGPSCLGRTGRSLSRPRGCSGCSGCTRVPTSRWPRPRAWAHSGLTRLETCSPS